MTVQHVYALVTLMGLYLSEASGHQKAFKELLAHIDDGHSLMLEKVQHEIIRFSNSRAPRAFCSHPRQRLFRLQPLMSSLL